jgi:hypothetical protein
MRTPSETLAQQLGAKLNVSLLFCERLLAWLLRRDTDCVLTTGEVQDMIERDAAAAAAGVDLNRVPNWRPAPPAEGEAPIGADAINGNPRPQI